MKYGLDHCKETNFSHYSALDGDWKGSIENLPKLEACKHDTSFSFLSLNTYKINVAGVLFMILRPKRSCSHSSHLVFRMLKIYILNSAFLNLQLATLADVKT